MTDAEILVPLKIDLQLSTTALDDYLTQQVNAAKEYIATEGITLDLENTGDVMLVVMYAAHLYRNRRGIGDSSKMPRMLRWALNNRLFHEKAAISDG